MFNEKKSWLNVERTKTALKIIEHKIKLDRILTALDLIYFDEDGYPLETINKMLLELSNLTSLTEKLKTFEEILAA